MESEWQRHFSIQYLVTESERRSTYCTKTKAMFTLRRRFSTFCSLTENTLWRCSRMNGATSIRTWLDYSTMGHLGRVAIDPANATGGIFQTYSPGPKCWPGARGSFVGDLYGSPTTRQAGRSTTK